MKYGSVCSGIEAATVAWHPLGWEAAWHSEIEPFPCAVLKHHYPVVPNYGDMTRYEEWPNEPINLLVGGTPCQSFSVAGLRKGLDDPRGNLMLTFGAIARRYRPEWLVWENVPGVLSSNGGRDFGTFLGMLAELGYGFAYRVLDAQYFGVAQRRRRVFVVANSRGWQRAAAVLFERHSLQGHPAPSREAGKEVAATTSARFGSSRDNREELAWPAKLASTRNASFGEKQGLEDQHALSGASLFVPDTMGTLTARMMNALGARDIEEGAVLPVTFGAQMSVPQTDVDLVQTLQARNPMAVAQPVTTFAKTHKPMSATDAEGWSPVDAAPTVTHWPRDRSDAETDVAVVQPMALDYEFNAHGIDTATGPLLKGSPSGGGHPLPAVMQPVAFKPKFFTRDNPKMEGAPNSSGTIGTLLTNDTGDNAPHVAIAMAVRRLTPTECERLQGFPDGYTNIPWRKKDEAPDGPRYRALGNSMAVPVMRWIGQRIAAVDAITKQEAANT